MIGRITLAAGCGLGAALWLIFGEVLTTHAPKRHAGSPAIHQPPRLAPDHPASDARPSVVLEAEARLRSGLSAAFAWARSAADPAERRSRLLAVIRAWGETDPVAAAQWALGESELPKALALEAALTGAAVQPQLLVELADALFSADPKLGEEQGSAVIRALAETGQFDAAIQLARNGPTILAPALIRDAYFQWALRQPQAAADAAQSLPDEPSRQQALQPVVEGWMVSDPGALARYLQAGVAGSIDPRYTGEARDNAFRQAVGLWSEHDPQSLADWLAGLPPGADFDTGASALAAFVLRERGEPDAAAAWAKLLSDPRRRQAIERELSLHPTGSR